MARVVILRHRGVLFFDELDGVITSEMRDEAMRIVTSMVVDPYRP